MERNFKYLSDEHARHLKSLIKKSDKLDSERKIFGASKHQYSLNPVISINKIREYEKKYNFKLPEEYVFFLTKVGNGGAGPHYGIYSLEEMARQTSCWGNPGEKAWIDENLTLEQWNEKMNFLDDCNDDDLYENEMSNLFNGFIIIGTQGCTYDTLLLCNGSEKGKIVYIDWNLEEGYMPHLIKLNFLHWYENFFLEVSNDHDPHFFATAELLTENEIIERYKNSNSMEDKKYYIGNLARFKRVEQKTLDFVFNDSDNFEVIRFRLLVTWNKELAIKYLDRMIENEKIFDVVDCLSSIPDVYKDRYYNVALQYLYKDIFMNGNIDRYPRILFFLKDCSSLKAKDIIDFLKLDNISNSTRRTALYVIKNTEDKVNFLDVFSYYMKNAPYNVALEALQAVNDVKSPLLVDTFKYMLKKYEGDRIMYSNLSFAFKSNDITLPEKS